MRELTETEDHEAQDWAETLETLPTPEVARAFVAWVGTSVERLHAVMIYSTLDHIFREMPAPDSPSIEELVAEARRV